MAHAYNGYREKVVALADWWSYGYNKIQDAVEYEDGVLTHENALGEEARKQSKLGQLFDNEICNLLVDEESKKSLNRN